ncbi:hypothetical protein VCRA2113O325_110105 [Vibrio crassostreae]|nr:hypothetical protein VCRA2113O322_110057 [Vibrio crassostreae]CAK1717795.1 hypothetical protein VCRA2113O326_110069 [Vibrio crassostreae]CAK2536344.1 hypothetical protein VCRA2113O321_110069 [Vibrio crassostreae]CAK2538521.1 hypothetical protein VCRA2113O323_110106 [Vibrio crassostreae]CAK2591355.1 hypothetical protein VCRA2113O325_110105 [Vibrio crassostreae]
MECTFFAIPHIVFKGLVDLPKLGFNNNFIYP